MPSESPPLPRPKDDAAPNTRWTDLVRYRRGLVVSWFGFAASWLLLIVTCFFAVVGPLGLALVVAGSDVIKPKASVENVLPASLHLASWCVPACAGYRFLDIETRHSLIEVIDCGLPVQHTAARPAAVPDA